MVRRQLRILLLNFGYGTGANGSVLSYIKTAPRFFFAGRSKSLQLADLVKKEAPDIIALVEVDGGSVRSGFMPQWQEIIELGGYSVLAMNKYLPGSIWNRAPILGMHMSAVLYYESIGTPSFCESLYFSIGMKRLVLRFSASDYDLYLVHMALDFPTRSIQHSELQLMIQKRSLGRPVIVAGDFNSFGSRDELNSLCEMAGLQFGSRTPLDTYPAYKPEKELENILVSKSVKVVSCEVLPNIISDHRALLMNLEL